MLLHAGYRFNKQNSWWYFIILTLGGYLKNHWTNARLVCTHLKALAKLNPNMAMKIYESLKLFFKFEIFCLLSVLDTSLARVNTTMWWTFCTYPIMHLDWEPISWTSTQLHSNSIAIESIIHMCSVYWSPIWVFFTKFLLGGLLSETIFSHVGEEVRWGGTRVGESQMRGTWKNCLLRPKKFPLQQN